MRSYRFRYFQLGKDLPTDIYISVVRSLFGDVPTLLVGSLAISLAVLVTSWKVGDGLLAFCALTTALVAWARAIDTQAYHRQRESIVTRRQALEWEQRYAIGAGVFVALLGIWCLIAFMRTDDPYVQLVSLASTIAYLVGVSGRNFASREVVLVQILCSAPFITLSLITVGDGYHEGFAVLLIAFFISLKLISDRLRRTLMDALIATREVTSLASRFDTALNNMPHGLCMFDAGHRLVVSNRRLGEILEIPADALHQGLAAQDMLNACVHTGTILSSGAERFAAEFEARLSGKPNGSLTIDVKDNRTLALTFQPMENGGSVVLVEDITERKNAEAKINHMARYDALTALPNRSYFRDQLDRALTMQHSGACAVLFVDLDGFKQVNETLGHPNGDALLCVVAERLRGMLRTSDFVARFGSDEFVVLQKPVTHPDDAATLARRIVEGLGQPYTISGNKVVVGASIGIAVAPDAGTTGDLLLKNAEMALFRAKAEGPAGWRFFEPQMNVVAQARRALELDLRNALATDAFELYFQPLINLRTKRISSCEALLRWPHPERGMVSPAEFIPVAEEMGLIVEIGNRVLRKACSECARWPADVRVAVNLSPIQFRRGNVVACVREALELSGLPAGRLEVEITESTLLRDTDLNRSALHQLHELGTRISLDDFGTGYSSLSYLHSFPFSKVKIDRSFLKDIEANHRSLTLLYGVARLSAELGMSVVVEGIETEEQLALITREPSVDEAQGFLFSKPVPAHDIRKLLFALPTRASKVA